MKQLIIALHHIHINMDQEVRYTSVLFAEKLDEKQMIYNRKVTSILINKYKGDLNIKYDGFPDGSLLHIAICKYKKDDHKRIQYLDVIKRFLFDYGDKIDVNIRNDANETALSVA